MRLQHNLLFSRLSSPNLSSLSPQGRCSRPLTNLVASSGLALVVPCPYIGGTRARCSTPGKVSPEQRRIPHPSVHAPLDAAQDLIGFLACESTLLAHVAFFINRHPHPSLQGSSQSLLCPSCLWAWGCPDSSVGHYLFQLQEVPPLRAVQSLWMASLPSSMLMAPHSLVLWANSLKVCSIPLSLSPTKMLNVLCATLKPSCRISDHSFSLIENDIF